MSKFFQMSTIFIRTLFQADNLSMYFNQNVHDYTFDNLYWLVVLILAALWDSISVYIGPSPRDRETEKRKDRGDASALEVTQDHRTTRPPLICTGNVSLEIVNG